MPIPNKIIVVKLISGLGNQLFQYAFARQLSLRCGVPLKMDTTFFEDQKLRNFSLHHYHINATIASSKEIERFTTKYKANKLSTSIYYKIEKYIPLNWRLYYQEKKWWLLDDNIYKLRPPFYINGYWQNHHYYKALSPIIKNELKLKVSLKPHLKQLLNEIIRENFSVAIHVRRGDYISDKGANQTMGVLPIVYYHKAIEIILERITYPTFYVFSDDIDWAKQNFNDEKRFIFISGNKDFEDLELMQNCKHQIIANSSFSWWGAFLNINPQKIVICPKNWLANAQQNAIVEIQMPEWIKI